MAAFVVAGATARQRYALDRAVELHERAIELAVSDEDRAIVLEQLGDDHDAEYDGDRALPPWTTRWAFAASSRAVTSPA
jgi:hypothetical protein